MTPNPSRSRAPVAIAVVLGLAGVGAVGSGIVLLASSTGDTTGSTTPVATTLLISTTAAVTTPIPEFMDVVDDSGVLTISVPAAWQDFDTGSWIHDGVDIGPSLSAATDRAAWVAGWDTPGVFVGATDQIARDDAFGDFSDACVFDSRSSIEADGLLGTGEWWTACGAGGTDFFVGVVSVNGTSDIVLFQIAAVDGDITDLVGHILSTFRHQ